MARGSYNVKRHMDQIHAYGKTIDTNAEHMEIYRGYIKFIKDSGYSMSGMDIVRRCEKMLDEAGYLSWKLQDTLESVFNKVVIWRTNF